MPLTNYPSEQPLPAKHQDTDGMPPGLDLNLVNKTGYVVFRGVFYAQPNKGNQTFARYCRIIFASPEVYVAMDLRMGNLYVVDRKQKLSLGCRMNAEFRADGEVIPY